MRLNKLIYIHSTFLVFMALSLVGCSSESELRPDDSNDSIETPESYPNILLIIADDMG